MTSQMSRTKKEKPFYALPEKCKSSVQIIREAKREIKLKSKHQRPSTPQVIDGARGWGSNTKNDKRPMSSLSEASHSSDSASSRPLSGIRLKPLQKSNGHERDSVFGDLNLEPSVKKIPLVQRRSNSRLTMPRIESSNSDLSSSLVSSDELSATGAMRKKVKKVSIIDHKKISDKTDKKMLEGRKTSTAERRISIGDNILVGVQGDVPDTTNEEASKIESFSEAVRSYLPCLEMLVSAGESKKEYQGVPVIGKIHQLFEDTDMFTVKFEGRLDLMKLLFKLLDSHLPTLSLHVVKLILKLGVVDKNLASVCRLLYKLCLDEKNVAEFLSLDLIGLFIQSLQYITLKNDFESLKYAVVLLDGFTSNCSLWKDLIYNQVHLLLLHLLKELSCPEISAIEKCSDIVLKALSSVTNFIEDDFVWIEMLNSDLGPYLIRIVNIYGTHVAVVKSVVVLMSKFADYDEEGCKALLLGDDVADILSNTLVVHQSRLFIVYHISCTISDILAFTSDLSPRLCSSPEFLDVLAEIFSRSSRQQIEILQSGHLTPSSHLIESLETIKSYTTYFTQILRLLANLCLDSSVGQMLAENVTFSVNLLDLIDAYKLRSTSSEDILVLMVCVLVTLHNIAYFIQSAETTVPLCIRIASTVIPLLSENYSHELRIEACKIVQNLTKIPDVRNFILKNNLIPAFVNLLIESENDIATGGYVVALNLLLSSDAKETFYKESGITKLLYKLHLCMCRDWRMAALLCQVLWNYCSDHPRKPLTDHEIRHIIKVLQYYTSTGVVLETDAEESKEMWKEEFCPVAKPLLDSLLCFI